MKVINVILIFLIILSVINIIFSFYASEVLDLMQLGYFMQYSGVVFFLLMITLIIRINIQKKNRK